MNHISRALALMELGRGFLLAGRTLSAPYK